jgi:hypothetical protein
MQGFFVPGGEERPLCELTRARAIGITTLTPAQYARLYQALPGVEVFRPFFEEEGSPRSGSCSSPSRA